MDFKSAFASARKKHGGDGGTFDWKGKKYTTDIAKEDSGGSSMFGVDSLKGAATDMAGGLAEGIANKVGGKAMGDAVKAGMSSGFNPYVMAGAVALGALKSRQEKKKAEAIGQGKAMQEKAKGESKKGDIYGNMAKSIESTLGAATRKRSVKL